MSNTKIQVERTSYPGDLVMKGLGISSLIPLAPLSLLTLTYLKVLCVMYGHHVADWVVMRQDLLQPL